MQRNQSFFASGSHLYIYDYFLSSRAKVRQNFGTNKLFLKKSLPQPLRRRGVRTCGKPLLPPFGRVGVGVRPTYRRRRIQVLFHSKRHAGCCLSDYGHDASKGKSLLTKSSFQSTEDFETSRIYRAFPLRTN